MSAVAKSDEKPLNSKLIRQSKSVSTMNSTDALALIEHGSELVLNITAPVGTKFNCKTAFIGTHSDSYILAEIPNISGDDFDYFFQEGFWTNVRAISPRGEGALVHFRSQLLHVIDDPIPLALFSIPNTMQITQLRKEPRYEVQLFGRASLGNHKMECEIRDLSRSGCRFFTPPLGKTYLVGDVITIDVFTDQRAHSLFGSVEGKICNVQRSVHYARYGLEFNDNGKESVKHLLNKLRFNGTKLTLHGEQ
ncbi:flagellar brake protein [Vibrio viridaestus]|uniref:Flagellar brake protein n=1 Tax=Vibrio viridaestus TaxID=2487322 RepID=A0A3N9TLQ4_9VIBR|nr:flagellar brake protein [Vibrio viridaestus]RQW64924.1 flagellar brake protein [Vibrio viridaestus]